MSIQILLLSLFLLCGINVYGEHKGNGTLVDFRQPRVVGRIVKLYSGTRPEPFLCQEEGFQPDPSNCALFYRCIRTSTGKYTVYRFQCGPGTVYDPETEVCNHPQNTKRTECGGKNLEPFMESHNDNEIAGNSPIELPKPISTRIPGNLDQINVVTQNPFISTTPQNQKLLQTAPPKLSTAYPWAASSNAPVKVTLNNRQGGDPCTTDGFMGDSENCHTFYRCVGNQRGGFIRYEFSCSETTVWDDEAQSCNHPWAVQKSRCGRRTIKREGSEDKEDTTTKRPITSSVQEQLQISYGSKVSQSQTQTSNGSAIQNQTQIHYGNRINDKDNTESKQNQTQISYGSAVSQSQTQIDYGNKSTQTQTQIDHSNQSSQSQTQTYESTSKTTTVEDTSDQSYGNQPTSEKPEDSGSSGGNQCSESGFMGDSKDCKKFYRCVDNGKGGYTRHEFKCGEGTVWDPDIEACNHPWATKRCGGGGVPPTAESNKEDTTTSTSTSTTAVPIIQITTQTPEENIDTGYGQPENEQTSTSTAAPTSKRPESGQSSNDNKCKRNGFIGDENECTKFYRCVDNGNGGYTRYEFSCGEGTVWDPKIEACNHPWAVEKCGTDNSTDLQKETTQQPNPTLSDNEVNTSEQTTSAKENDQTSTQSPATTSSTSITATSSSKDSECETSGFMGDQNDCKKFYRCVDDGKNGYTRYEFTCGEGTVWDRSIEACNHAWAVNDCKTSEGSQSQSESTSQSSVTSPTDKTDQTGQTTSEKSTTQTNNVQEQTSSGSPPSADDSCKSEGFHGDSNDCKKFYRCVDNGEGGYIKYDFTCGEGTIWDEEIQTCNYDTGKKDCSSNSGSESSNQTGTQGTEDYPSGTSTESNNDNQSTQQTESLNSSIDKCTSEGFFANSNDCKKFYRCVPNENGGYVKYDFVCGEGTVWVQEIQACDHDDGSQNCTIQGTSTTESSQPTSEKQPYSSERPVTSETAENPDRQDDETSSDSSSGECTSEGYYGDPNDCTKFYRCVDNGKGGYTKYDFDCGEGTAWDTDLQTCNYINEVKSCKDNENQKEPESGTSTSTEKNSDNNNDCTQTGNSSSPQSSESGSTTESSKPNNKDTCEKEGYFGNSQDCKKFYRCVDNGKGGLTKYDFDCGEGTIWDQDVTTCNHPQDVANPSCQQSSENTDGSSSTTSSSSSSSTSDLQSTTSSTTESNSQGGSNCENSSKKPANKNVNCTKAGYYPNPDDCKKFYRCVDWDGEGKRFSVYHFECGEGTIWDPALDTCNHEESVYPPRDCSQSQGENVSKEPPEESSTTEQSSTTQSSTTEEQTITEQSTTSEQTTTQQSTTSEQTTTQESTTTEQTTTQQSTTSEQTTSEQTTAEQSTTSEQTTTQQSTTSEKTTTEESTISEQTTTQQSTTSEQTTTQQTTTSEKTTTQEPTTTEQTTTSEQTTTQDSTTTEKSTTEHTTTEQSTTESSGGEETTTQETTTTEQSTDNTTQESTTSENETTEESSTTESTTTEATEETEGTTEGQGGTTESSSSSDKDCPDTEEDQHLFVCPTSFRRHPKYCNLFYQCDENDDNHEVKIAIFHCPNNTIYDESKSKCVELDKADKKCDGEIAQKRRFKRLDTDNKEPIIASKESLKCTSVGFFPFENEECSPAFLKCQTAKTGKLRGLVYKCPEGYVYWKISKRCEAKSKVPFCKSSFTNWNERWEIPVERRNVAP